VLLFATRRSQYAVDAGRGLFLQLPGGTPCGLRQGVWHQVVWDRQPKEGEPFFCSVAPRDGGPPLALRTGAVTWVGPEPPEPALYEILAAAAARLAG
jgi:hypothetical protein